MGVFLLLNEDGTFTRLKFLCSEEDGTPAQPTVLHLRTETLTKILAGLPKDEKIYSFQAILTRCFLILKPPQKISWQLFLSVLCFFQDLKNLSLNP